VIDPHFLRILSERREAPTPARIRQAVQEAGFPVRLTSDAEDGSWRELLVEVAGGPATVERSVSGDIETFVEDEVADFLELLSTLERSPARERVRAHLRATEQVILIAAPSAGAAAPLVSLELHRRGPGDDRDAIDALAEYLLSECGGLLHSDEQGFFDESGLILETE
jgi:hypothetical protein